MSLDQFTRALDEGVENGVLGEAKQVRGIEVATARTWLFLLGYIKRDNEKRSLDEVLLTGLEKFRKDSGIVSVDGGLDAETLGTLRKLMSFDPRSAEGSDVDGDPGIRFRSLPADGPLMLRAVGVRLYALDLVERLPGRDPDIRAIQRGLERFSRITALLNLKAASSSLTHATIAALYDSEPVIERLRKEKQSLTIAHPQASSTRQRRDNRKLVKNYINALARIELWLIGYLTRPRKRMWSRDNTNRSLPSALRAFWRDQPEAVRPPARQREVLAGHFFDRVQAVIESATEESMERDEELQQKILDDPKLAKAVMKETRSLGARLLDGVRRVSRFILGWIHKGLGGLLALARNIASVMANRVRKVFAAVHDVVLSMADSWQYLTGKPMQGSHPDHLVLFHDMDFDFILVAHPEADFSRVKRISGLVAVMANLFAATVTFIDRLVSLFVSVVRRAGLGGWFGAILAMLSIRHRIGEMREIVHRIRQGRRLIEELA